MPWSQRGLILVIGLAERELEGQRRAVGEQGLHPEAVIAPLALQARDQSAFERRMRLLLEQVHERRAGERVVARVAEQLEPRPVGIDDDALLHVGDRIGRAFEKPLQLLAVLARRGQSRRQRALQAVRAQLAGHDRLQAAAVGERHHILGAQAHRLRDRRLIDLFAHDQHGHLGCGLLLDLGDGCEVDLELVDERHEHLGIELGDRVRQVAGVGQPGAVHRMAGLSQRAVDRLDVVLRPRHDDHRNGALFAHCCGFLAKWLKSVTPASGGYRHAARAKP
jgi:hypothetical protein